MGKFGKKSLSGGSPPCTPGWKSARICPQQGELIPPLGTLCSLRIKYRSRWWWGNYWPFSEMVKKIPYCLRLRYLISLFSLFLNSLYPLFIFHIQVDGVSSEALNQLHTIMIGVASIVLACSNLMMYYIGMTIKLFWKFFSWLLPT